MKVGIYLAWAPAKGMSIAQEGLGRLLGFVLKGLVEGGTEVLIACPKWLFSTVDEVLEQENIDRSKVEYLFAGDMPFLWKLYLKISDKDKKPKRKSKFKKAVLSIVGSIVDYLVNIRNGIEFCLFVAGVFLICMLLFVPFMLGLLLFEICKFINRLGYDKAIFKVKKNKIYRKIWNYLNPQRLVGLMRERSAKDLVKKSFYIKNPPDVWYSPTAFWPEFNDLKGVKVICAPDIVPTEFPTNFSSNCPVWMVNNVKSTISAGTYFITYCNFVRDFVLLKRYNKCLENIKVIPHSVNRTDEFIDLSKTLGRYEYNYDINVVFARKILQQIIANSVNVKDYIDIRGKKFSFKNVQYVFYASQIRGSKNVLNLIRAYNILLKEKSVQLKLFLTGNINANRDIIEYVEENQLQYDVLCFANVNSQQLSALYKCAELVVNPTLYEGGFPFTFSEGMSVGTPSVMSAIPQVLDVVEGYELEQYIFDPYNYHDMADKILYALENKAELLIKEKKLYLELAKRSWNDVAQEYVQAFQYFAEKDRQASV